MRTHERAAGNDPAGASIPGPHIPPPYYKRRILLLLFDRNFFQFYGSRAIDFLLPHGNHPPRPLSGSWIPHFLALSPAASPPGMGVRIFRRCIAVWPSPQVFPRCQFRSSASEDRARLSGLPVEVSCRSFPAARYIVSAGLSLLSGKTVAPAGERARTRIGNVLLVLSAEGQCAVAFNQGHVMAVSPAVTADLPPSVGDLFSPVNACPPRLSAHRLFRWVTSCFVACPALRLRMLSTAILQI